MSREFKQQIINGYDQENISNKIKNMFKSLAKRSRREKNLFFANTENTLVTNTVTPVTPVAEKNDDGKRISEKYKTGN